MKQCRIQDMKKNPYTSGSKSTGTTALEELKHVKENARKTRHEPDYILDTPDRKISKIMEALLKP